MYLTLLIKDLIFFNDLFFSRLSIRQNSNNFASLSTLLAFNRLNSINEKSN